MSIEDRITEILDQHFWIEHRMQCLCGYDGGKRPWEYGPSDYCAHVARVIVTELGITEQEGTDFTFGGQRRYVTPWENT